MLSVYESHSMNSECMLSVLLSTGEILWRLTRTGKGEHGRGVGAWGTSTLSYLDGTPVARFCAKDTLCEVDLETGAFTREPKLLTDWTTEAMKALGIYKEQDVTTYSSIDDPFTSYGTPILCGEDIIIAGSFGGFGILGPDHAARWWKIASFGDVLYRLPGIGDLDGDGALEYGQSHADGSFSIYDYLTGARRANVDLGAIATDVLSMDFNGDGRDEFVVAANDGRLLVLGRTASGFGILAEISSRSGLGSPIAADLDGNGTSVILCASADGWLTCYENDPS
jgi:outer membrane protein assembly factor BamB